MSKVSIIVPTYNRARLLQITLESVLAQTYPNIEVIVVDNASTDETPDLMKQYEGRVRYIRKPVNKGMTDSYNMGWQAATGDLLMFLDSDDVIEPRMIELEVAYLATHPEADFVYTRFYNIDESGRRLQKVWLLPQGEAPRMLEQLVHGNFIWLGSTLFRRSRLEKVGPWDERCSLAQDWDMFFRLALQGCRFACIQQPLGAYRHHLNNSTHNVLAVEQTWLATLEKVFSHPALPENVRALRNAAYTVTHLWMAVKHAQARQWQGVQRQLTGAWDLNAAHPDHTRQLLKQLRNIALYLCIQDLVGLVQGILDHLPSRLDFLRSQSSALIGEMYLCQAMRDYDMGDFERGQANILRALEADPSLPARRNMFIDVVTHRAVWSLAESPQAFVRIVMDKLPFELRTLRRTQHQILGNIDYVQACADFQAGRYNAVIHDVFQAVKSNPSLLRDRGLRAMFVRSAFPALQSS